MRAIRVASHNTASTAGSPIMTDSEITVPALATALIEAEIEWRALGEEESRDQQELPREHRREEQQSPQAGAPELPDSGLSLCARVLAQAASRGTFGQTHQSAFNRRADQGNARSSRPLMSSPARSTAPYMLA